MLSMTVRFMIMLSVVTCVRGPGRSPDPRQHRTESAGQRRRIVPRCAVGDGDPGAHDVRTQRFCRSLQAGGIADGITIS
jgi:hypothetical protein